MPPWGFGDLKLSRLQPDPVTTVASSQTWACMRFLQSSSGQVFSRELSRQVVVGNMAILSPVVYNHLERRTLLDIALERPASSSAMGNEVTEMCSDRKVCLQEDAEHLKDLQTIGADQPLPAEHNSVEIHLTQIGLALQNSIKSLTEGTVPAAVALHTEAKSLRISYVENADLIFGHILVS